MPFRYADAAVAGRRLRFFSPCRRARAAALVFATLLIADAATIPRHAPLMSMPALRQSYYYTLRLRHAALIS